MFEMFRETIFAFFPVTSENGVKARGRMGRDI